MADKSDKEFGKRKPVSVPASPRPASPPAKRSGHVALLLMGTIRGRQRRLRADAEPELRAVAEYGLAVAPAKQCQMLVALVVLQRPGGSGGGSSRSSYYSSDSSSSHSSSGTSDSGSHSAQRGGFGSFGHAVGFSGG